MGGEGISSGGGGKGRVCTGVSDNEERISTTGEDMNVGGEDVDDELLSGCTIDTVPEGKMVKIYGLTKAKS